MELARTKNDDYTQSNKRVVKQVWLYIAIQLYKPFKGQVHNYIFRALKYPKPLIQKLDFWEFVLYNNAKQQQIKALCIKMFIEALFIKVGREGIDLSIGTTMTPLSAFYIVTQGKNQMGRGGGLGRYHKKNSPQRY